jgi:hypothetical protein
MAKEWEIITKTDFWGKKSYEIVEKKDSGVGCLILFGLIAIMVMSLFTAPYRILDRDFKIFSLRWLKDSNVWLFCLSSWICALTSLVMIRSFFKFATHKQGAFEQTYDSPYTTFGLFTISTSVVTAYILKVKQPEHFSIAYVIYAMIILSVFFLLVRKTADKVKYSILGYSLILLILPFVWVWHSELSISTTPQYQKIRNLTLTVKSASGANIRQLPSKASNVLIKLPDGAEVEFLADSTYADNIIWYKIKTNEYTGWVSKKLVHSPLLPQD